MKTNKINTTAIANLTGVVALAFSTLAWASDTETSASATGGRARSGTAIATARYEGDVGFARTDTRTGNINLARGVAVGVDEDGLSLSVSLAIAPLSGPAFATNFNLSFESDGDVATSFGTSRATGGTSRTVAVGGRASATPYRPLAMSTASGVSRNGGVVRTYTHSNQYERREVAVRRVIRIR
jgi:hypothetical protein